jgi:hypothetical protein
MKLDTDAEKIVIYLTPFVLNINLKIIIYEFDTDSNFLIKEFPCAIDNSFDVILLYRKTHYDLVYQSQNFDKNAKELCFYVNLNENLRVLKSEVLDSLRSHRYSSRSANIADHSNDSEKYEIKENPFSTCLACSNFYVHKSNILNLCVNCLTTELMSQMMANYLIFLNECMACYEDSNENNIPQIFNESKLKIIFII